MQASASPTTPTTPHGGVPISGAARQQAGIGGLLRMENMKLRARPMTKILLAIAALGTALFMTLAYVAVRASSYSSEAERQADIRDFMMPNGLNDGMQVSLLLTSILITVLGASIAGSEFGWGTVRVMVGTGQSRARMMVAKALAVLQYSFIFAVVSVASIVATSYVLGLIGGHDLNTGWLDATFVGDFFGAFARLWFLIFLSGAFAFSIALLTRSLAAGIAIGIGIGVVEGIVVALLGQLGNIGDTIVQGLMTPNMNSVMDHMRVTGESGNSGGLNELQALGVLGLYTFVPLIIAIAVFRKRDIASGA